jgi:hypothetical protein
VLSKLNVVESFPFHVRRFSRNVHGVKVSWNVGPNVRMKENEKTRR